MDVDYFSENGIAILRLLAIHIVSTSIIGCYILSIKFHYRFRDRLFNYLDRKSNLCKIKKINIYKIIKGYFRYIKIFRVFWIILFYPVVLIVTYSTVYLISVILEILGILS